MDQMTENT